MGLYITYIPVPIIKLIIKKTINGKDRRLRFLERNQSRFKLSFFEYRGLLLLYLHKQPFILRNFRDFDGQEEVRQPTKPVIFR